MQTSSIPDTIVDQAKYLSAMRKSLVDKAFFIDKIFEPIENIVDFGCADGSLIAFIKDVFPEYNFIGYDKSKQMIKAGKENYPSLNLTDDWESIVFEADKSLLNLSSVIHEVYSYCTDDEIAEFWDRVYNTGFKYITFRDMMLFEKTKGEELAAEELVIPEKYKEVFKSYTDIWGDIKTRASYIHFILKSQYIYNGNLERELKENYFPIYVEDFIRHIPDNYEIVYSENYILPYLKWWISKEYGIKIETPTHMKCILKKKDGIS